MRAEQKRVRRAGGWAGGWAVGGGWATRRRPPAEQPPWPAHRPPALDHRRATPGQRPLTHDHGAAAVGELATGAQRRVARQAHDVEGQRGVGRQHEQAEGGQHGARAQREAQAPRGCTSGRGRGRGRERKHGLDARLRVGLLVAAARASERSRWRRRACACRPHAASPCAPQARKPERALPPRAAPALTRRLVLQRAHHLAPADAAAVEAGEAQAHAGVVRQAKQLVHCGSRWGISRNKRGSGGAAHVADTRRIDVAPARPPRRARAGQGGRRRAAQGSPHLAAPTWRAQR